jgi:hypothetical protein
MKEKYSVRNMLFLDEDRTKEIKIGDDVFKVRALFPKERKEIARRVSIEQNGLPSNSFTMNERFLFERSASIDTAIMESPSWWKNADEAPDEELLNDLYEEINNWTDEFQEKLKKNRLNKRGAEEPVPS